MIGPVLPVPGEHDIIMDRPPEVMVKQTCVISGGSVHENQPAGVIFCVLEHVREFKRRLPFFCTLYRG